MFLLLCQHNEIEKSEGVLPRGGSRERGGVGRNFCEDSDLFQGQGPGQTPAQSQWDARKRRY